MRQRKGWLRRALVLWVTLAACGGDPAARGDGGSSRADATAPREDGTVPRSDGGLDDPDGAATPPPPPPAPRTFAAAAFDPSEPGWLQVAPESVVLRPGERVALQASVHVFDGAAVPAEVMSWTSSAPDVATVDGTGNVVAARAGLAEIVAEDVGHRVRTVTVAVSAEPPPGAVGIVFSQPLVSLDEGGSVEVGWMLTDARGAMIAAPSAPSFESVGSADVTLTVGPGTLRIAGVAGGTTRVIATLGAEEPPLAGTLVVSVARPPRIGPCGADDEDEIDCWLEAPPDTFTTPGLSDTLRVWASERSCGEVAPRVRQVAPDDITLADDRVLMVSGDGRLTAVAPGFSSFGVRYRGVPCDCPVARVLPSPDGCWTARCASGDEGVMSISGWRSHVIHAPRPGRVALTFQTEPATGRSHFLNEMAPRFECDEAASWEPSIALYGGRYGYCEIDQPPAGGEARWVPQEWLCSERGCESYDPQFCALSHNAPEGPPLGFRTTLRGDDTFDFLACSFERASASECVLPVTPEPVTGSAMFEGASVEVSSASRLYDVVEVIYATPEGPGPSVEVRIKFNGLPMLGPYPIAGSTAAATICSTCVGATVTHIISFPDDIDILSSACDTMMMLGTAEITEVIGEISSVGGLTVAGRFDLQVYRSSADTCGGPEMRHLTGSFRGTPMP